MKGKIGKCNYIKNKNFYPYKPLWSKNISYKFGQDTYRTTQELLYSIYKNFMNKSATLFNNGNKE